MKKILYIIAALTAGASLLQAQNTPTNLNLPVGAGIASPTATFHSKSSGIQKIFNPSA